MLRFRPTAEESTTSRRQRGGAGTRLRWRVWLLLIALGLVIATMRQLNKPSTARRLEQIFSSSEFASQQDSEHQFALSIDDSRQQQPVTTETVERTDPAVPSSDANEASDALSQVQDNTYFRPAENEAWFHLLSRLRQMDDQELRKETLGELTYAQLLKQPRVYRGQIVTVRGTLRREEVEQAPKNSSDIEAYHRLVIQPRGGGHWPFVVYCLELPNGFPRGDNLKGPITVTGFFFKNWSYAWQDGLGVAPVVLARSVDWQPVAAKASRRTTSDLSLITAILVACGFAAAVVWLVLHNTRRPHRFAGTQGSVVLPDEQSTTETINEQLQRLAEAETQE